VTAPVALRPANGADARGLERLAQLDSAPVPAGRLLVAESGGCLLAAVSAESGEAIADPFTPTAHVVEALRAYATRPPERRPQWKLSPCPPPSLAT
jgi:hypothetical protein